MTRSLLRLVDIAIGTSDEVNAATLTEASSVSVEHSQISDARVAGDLGAGAAALLAAGPEALVVTRGREGATIYTGGEEIDALPYPVQVMNILGAGDAFASGFLYGYLKGWGWRKAARMGNACGAIVVTRHGCANFMPFEQEALAFAEERGGLE